MTQQSDPTVNAPGNQPIPPQSSVLSEARADSLTELLNRDPEGYSRQDRAAIIAAYRDLRARLERAANDPAAAKPSKRKAPGLKTVAPSVTAAASAEELDL